MAGRESINTDVLSLCTTDVASDPLPYTVGGGLTQSGGEYLDLPREESVLLHEQFINRPGEKVREYLDLPWEESVLHHEQFINIPGEKVGSTWIYP